MQQRFISARETHHCFIDGCITVRIVLHRVTNNLRTLGKVPFEKSHFIHCVKELTVRWFETVNFGDCTGDDNAHYVWHIVLFNRFGNGLVNDWSVNDFFFFFLLLSCHSVVSFLSGYERYGEASAPYTFFIVCAAARISRL